MMPPLMNFTDVIFQTKESSFQKFSAHPIDMNALQDTVVPLANNNEEKTARINVFNN